MTSSESPIPSATVMTDQPRPLGYQSSLTVIEHMDANYRYLIVARCPSLRSIHTLVPLKIHHLALNTFGFTVDSLTHSFRTFIRNFNQLPMAWGIAAPPPEGFSHDLDRFGHAHVEDPSEGDITIQKWFVDFQALMEPRQVPDEALEPEPNFAQGAIDMREIDYRTMRDERDQARRDRVNNRARVHTFLKYNLMGATVEYPEDKKLAWALRNFTRNYFAASKVSVKIFEIAVPFGVLRLPEDLQFHVDSLKTTLCARPVINAVSPLLANGPPRKLAITVRKPDDTIFRHDVMKDLTSLSLKIDTADAWVNILISIKTPNFEVLNYPISQQELVILGKHWINHPRALGSKISFELNTVGTLLDRVTEHLRAAKATLETRSLPEEFPHCGTVQINLTTELNIYVQKVSVKVAQDAESVQDKEAAPVEMADQDEEAAQGDDQKWKLVFEMMEVGAAREVDN